MKKLLILVIILVLPVLGYMFLGKEDATTDTTNPTTTTQFQPNPESATFLFDDGSITLINGRRSIEDSETGLSDDIWLLDEKASGDLNSDGKTDSAVLLARSGGGSGTFIYLAAYVSGPVNYKGSNAIFVGDRIAPESITISNGVATFHYLDRGDNEPMSAEPTVETTKQFVYKNGTLEEK